MAIQINANSLVPAATTFIQRAIIAALTYFGATGVISDDGATKIASALVSIALVVWGAVASYKSNEDKKVMNTFAPNNVSVTKGATNVGS